MKLEKALYQRSYLYFIIFFLLALVGFWFTYFTKILEQENYRLHTHGVSLILWCLMLIIQPYLIRTKRYELHKIIGKISYVLVPVLIFTTVDLLKFRLTRLPALAVMDFFFVALVLNALVAFVILYGLAIFYLARPTIHARYMLCTALPMVTPITDRIIHIYFSFLVPYLPTIEGNPIAPVVGFAIVDLLLIGLIVWDWRSHKRWNVFPVALFVLLMYHYSVLNFYKFDFWQAFSRWFVEL